MENKKIFRYEKDYYTKMLEKALGDFWTYSSVNYVDDRAGFETLEPREKHMFKATLGYQSLMDTDVTGGYFDLAKLVDSKTLKNLYIAIGHQEMIHFNSYSYGIDQVFGSNANEIFDWIESQQDIFDRMIVENRDEELAMKEPTKENVIKHIINTFLLEQIKFPLSFYVTFKINDNNSGAINGFTQALKEIAHDELTTHVPTNAYVLKNEFKEYRDYIELKLKERINEIIKEEIKWMKFLFKEGEASYLNEKMYTDMLKYFINKALELVGFEEEYEDVNKIEILWFNEYRKINNTVVSQQETDSVAYSVNVVRNINDLDKEVKNG